MFKNIKRNQKIAKEIKKHISVILQNNIKDPRIINTRVSHVNLSIDLSYAKIFVTFPKHNNCLKDIKYKINILQNKAKGFIKNILTKHLLLRIIPEIIFIYDHSLQNTEKIYLIINNLIEDKYNIKNIMK